MFVKATVENSAFSLHEVFEDLTFLGAQYQLHLDTTDPDFEEDEQLPKAERTHTIILNPKSTNHAVRWVKWTDVDGFTHRLISDSPVYIVNDEGRTVEVLRAPS